MCWVCTWSWPLDVPAETGLLEFSRVQLLTPHCCFRYFLTGLTYYPPEVCVSVHWAAVLGLGVISLTFLQPTYPLEVMGETHITNSLTSSQSTLQDGMEVHRAQTHCLLATLPPSMDWRDTEYGITLLGCHPEWNPHWYLESFRF